MSNNGGSAIGRARRSIRSEATSAQIAERKQACVHALLNRPWILKEDDQELYFSIKDHYEELRDWFMDQAGFPLLMTRSLAKLERTPVVAHPWMGFEEFREIRDYVFFTYALWFLEGKTEMDQFLLSDVVEEVREQLAAVGLEADWRHYHHRLSMARALKKLSSLGVLIAVDGDEGDWAQSESRNVLYECSPHSRYVLRRFPQDLTTYSRMEELSEPILYANTPDGDNIRRRHRVYRRFLLEPVVLDRHWDAESLPYVLTQRRSIMDHLQRMLGLEGRRYREGLLFFYPEPTSEAVLFPTLSGVSDLVLLIAGELRRQLGLEGSGRYAEADGSIRLERSELEGILLRLQERHQDYWSKEFRTSSSAQLAELVFAHMEQWRLGEWEDAGHFLISPVVSRWNGMYDMADV
ncbi:TIGR02678 family protein [Paenibacillus oceani]|uniref:TIGR02678 family protein n=1 Tax=Paenibacillus oceani TaxID=2772510 RepID=A0A927C9C7_9BACL|nr:TIGR02678 family protein [Paenibacillus oceani]MBD2862508.1 TIGR02678 family protein [Paenibacillus oceani]